MAQGQRVRPRERGLDRPTNMGPVQYAQEVLYMTVDVYSTASVHALYSNVVCMTAGENGTVTLMQQTDTNQVSSVFLAKPHHVVVNY